jgi:hypothetical protein
MFMSKIAIFKNYILSGMFFGFNLPCFDKQSSLEWTFVTPKLGIYDYICID